MKAHKNIVSVLRTLFVDGGRIRILFIIMRSYNMIYDCVSLLISVAPDKIILIIFQIRKVANVDACCGIRT